MSESPHPCQAGERCFNNSICGGPSLWQSLPTTLILALLFSAGVSSVLRGQVWTVVFFKVSRHVGQVTLSDLDIGTIALFYF